MITPLLSDLIIKQNNKSLFLIKKNKNFIRNAENYCSWRQDIYEEPTDLFKKVIANIELLKKLLTLFFLI